MTVFSIGRSLRACCPNQFPLQMWGRHSCLPVLGTFQSPDSASNCQLWSAKLEYFTTGRLESPPYNLGNTSLTPPPTPSPRQSGESGGERGFELWPRS